MNDLNLEGLSDQGLADQLRALNDEVNRRAEIKAQEEARRRAARMQLILDDRDILLKHIEHERTSCSDENPINGLGSARYGARCHRCALLTLDSNDFIVYDVSVTLQIQRVDTEDSYGN